MLFLLYANQESDDVVSCATKMVNFCMKNISGNIKHRVLLGTDMVTILC